jgi:biotin-dependent carboxylase-like uncharacterized protein
MNPIPTFEILDGGLGATIQDAGRFGFQRFGVPPSGAMDEHAFHWANKLLDNPPDAPCLEILMGGLRLRALSDCWIATAGADLGATVNGERLTAWKTARLCANDTLEFFSCRSGLWCYLAVQGGFDAPQFFGSASVYQRGALGSALDKGGVLKRNAVACNFPGCVAARYVVPAEVPDYSRPLVAQVVPGPQEALFAERDLDTFFGSTFTVTSQIDRVGYRLEGAPIRAVSHDIFSEGIAYGAIQIPEDGQPIVMMKDRPTVGGYPKIGTLLPEDTARLAQCRTGQAVRFARV